MPTPYPSFLPTASTPVLQPSPCRNRHPNHPNSQPHAHPASPPHAQPPLAPFHPPPCSTLPTKPAVIWLRHDLRLHDHPLFHHASQLPAPVIPLYLLPNHDLNASLISSLHSLRKQLRHLGSDLYVRPLHSHEHSVAEKESVRVARVMTTFCRNVNAGVVYYGYADRRDEQRVEKMVTAMLGRMGVETRGFWTNGLYVPEMLPFDVRGNDFPEDCDAFASRIKTIEPMAPLQRVERIRGISGVGGGEIPALDPRGAGGEERGLQWVEEYCDGKRGGLVEVGGGGVSVKFRGLGRFVEEGRGCLSVRWVWWRAVRGESLKRYCAEWELMWAEYKRLMRLRQLDRAATSSLTTAATV
eukprot:GFKZ01013611.1.p1 GENE.GFKZ01013611.1~~GFKZ01013611.1.p1  ORF type:complete len:378 (-),score=24.99 GFKZ01013611.1:181-1245(-)